ncbi:uncharacterized protein LOC122950792 [Acropora millepora]|uniref:uncharacterized protein LOC122950792 n=1 Tax=Acropora millepora TaxID=45264 RepID=UPI001CF1DDAD|nr:uncharacterized protein LOC122950792 [Acropora millepora]
MSFVFGKRIINEFEKNNSTYCPFIGRSKKSNDTLQQHPVTREKVDQLNSLFLAREFILPRSFVEAIKTSASKSSNKANQGQKVKMEAIKAVPKKRDGPKEKPSVPLSCAAEMRALPAAFALAEPMKDPGNQMPTASYTFGKSVNSYGDWDS